MSEPRQAPMTLRGRTALVTGSTGGIGKETARGLAALGARVVLVGRDRRRADAAAAELARGGAEITAHTADLTRRADLRRLAAEITQRHPRLHILINNAGGMTPARTLTPDGVEQTFAANVLAPYTLTCLLLPALRAAGDARVVNLTGGIPGGALDPANLQGEKAYLGWRFSQYNHAKTAVMAMSRHLAARLEDTGVTVNVAYPGHAHTPGNQALPIRAFPYAYRPLAPLIRLLGPLLLSDLAKPARSSLHLASSPDLDGVTGAYYNAHSRRTPWPATVLDERNTRAVGDLCARLSGVTAP
ncbi:SDR family NAD(P)-dependent oxidoreductase [Spirillospora sp. NBC_01491]|uniref:SDR family NAD(P)-dependent oxidoreductase n=1 Tax=Spirillospora sp. NBC_01491 TaxID=2976007 RepID=UPI002E2EE5B5|nr:SDR family NAD(P)-dependent oxidoreductase [Spirillospora sp. NBC_01491]